MLSYCSNLNKVDVYRTEARFTLENRVSPARNGSHRLMYWNTWSPAGRAAGGGLGDVAILEEVCHWVWFEVLQDS